MARVEAVNVGLPEFAYALLEQGAAVVDVDWRPPAAGDSHVAATAAVGLGAWGASSGAALLWGLGAGAIAS